MTVRKKPGNTRAPLIFDACVVRAQRGKHVAEYKEARALLRPLESSPARRDLGCAPAHQGTHARDLILWQGERRSFTQDRAGTVKVNSGPYERYITYFIVLILGVNTILFRVYRASERALALRLASV